MASSHLACYAVEPFFTEKLSDHLSAIENQVAQCLKWALYTHLKKDQYSGLHKFRESDLFKGGSPGDMPEVYTLYGRSCDYHTLWYAGGLADQPDILMREFDACRAGENQYHNDHEPFLRKMDAEGRTNGTR